MTAGTTLAFIFTGVIGLVALVGAICLEQRMPDPQHQRIAARSPGPASPGGPAARRPVAPVAPASLGPAHPSGRHYQ